MINYQMKRGVLRMKYQGNTGKLRKAMDAVGMQGDAAWIFNDLRKSGYRRLKIWRHFDGDINDFLALQAACQKEFGWDMIACGLQNSDGGRQGSRAINFVVKLKL
jgi:hypothetical protein